MLQQFHVWPRFRSRFAALTILALGAGCASPPSAAGKVYTAEDFTLVVLRAGPAASSMGEALSLEHTSFLERLAQEGTLLFSGWFGPTRAEEDLRGILLMDAGDRTRAAELLGPDPAIVAGVLRAELISLTTLDVIRFIPAMETARQRRREEAGEDMARSDIHAYTILTAPDGPRAAKTIFQHPAVGGQVVLMGRMRAPRQDELFAILDVPTASELEARLDLANPEGLEVRVSEWFGSPVIAELAQAGGPPEDLATPQ